MNLVMRGILPDNILTRNGDTLEEDWPYFDEADPQGTYDPLYVDAVVSNPPYSQRWDPEGKENDPRYKGYGIAPKSKADYAFLLHDLYHLKPDGMMTIVLPHGVLFRGGEEGVIRKNLIEKNNIEAIIGLPANIFFGTGIPTIIMVLRQKRESTNTDVLIIDASKGFAKEGKNNKLRASDIRRIVDTVRERRTVPKFSRLVSLKEIRENDYNLNIPRYVDSQEEAESYDIYASMFGGIPEGELEKFAPYWKEFPSLKEELFTGEGGYLKLRTEEIKNTVKKNKDVEKYLHHFQNAFQDLGGILASSLIEGAESLSVPKTEESLTAELFSRFDAVSLLDPYQAYELFEKEYTEIAGDLELIQTEGMQAIKQVDPNMLIKKKNGKELELQEGWKGHILPFDLVQKRCLTEELSELSRKRRELEEVGASIEELLESLSEEDKESISEVLSDENDAFVFKNMKAVLKNLQEDAENNGELLSLLKKADRYNSEEKSLKSEIKDKEDALHLKTKETIENLTEEQGKELLYDKWIVPIVNGIDSLPDTMLQDFIKALESLSKKYETTMSDLEEEIAETSKELVAMLSELSGSEHDMAGIQELCLLLGGDVHE